ncbi:PDE9A (predicted) [Pycnogonum litorale]
MEQQQDLGTSSCIIRYVDLEEMLQFNDDGNYGQTEDDNCNTSMMSNMESSRKYAFRKRSKSEIKLRKTLALVKSIFNWWSQVTIWKRKRRNGTLHVTRIYITPLLTIETKKSLATMHFETWKYKYDDLGTMLMFMFEDLNLLNDFKIGDTTLINFFCAVQERYQDVPYHNFRHGFCVTQAMYAMIQFCNLSTFLPKWSILALMVASICHDIDHPGLTNSYCINSNNNLAILYDGISPLENHHCAVTLEILGNKATNILKNLGSVLSINIIEKIKDMILSTDMRRHNEIIEKYRSCLENCCLDTDKNKKYFEMLLIKGCDVSNDVRPIEISRKLDDRLYEEFELQFEREKREGLPLIDIMNCKKFNRTRSQIQFLTAVPIPIFEELAKLFPPIHEHMILPLKDTIRYYEIEKTKEKSSTKGININLCEIPNDET